MHLNGDTSTATSEATFICNHIKGGVKVYAAVTSGNPVVFY